MSEAIISRRGNGSTTTGGTLSTEIVIVNKEWVVPRTKGNVHVMIYGAGGGGSVGYSSTSSSYYPSSNRNKPYGAGGGGGWMNNGEFYLVEGTIVSITIGTGGNYVSMNGINGGAGGTTSFGTYLSANGGSSIIFNEYTRWGGGGDGGSGGGGAIDLFTHSIQREEGVGGSGYQFGGGGSIGTYYDDDSRTCGNGGPYGGGGGTGYELYRLTRAYGTSVNGSSIYGSNNGGIAGIYGGNGGYVATNNRAINSENGTNTIGNNNVEVALQGAGLAGNRKSYTNYGNTGYAFGGGGGYGGNGGNGGDAVFVWSNMAFTYNGVYYNYSSWTGSGGGGGGYGGNGGDGGFRACGGGGGGYGNGGNGINCFGGGGGGYGDGGEYNRAPGYGGGGCYLNAGGNGICIIQYYA